MMQNLLDNPEMIQQMMMSNPQVQAIINQNPEMANILRDPAVLRQSMQVSCFLSPLMLFIYRVASFLLMVTAFLSSADGRQSRHDA
jgi:hypothetical protein